jgi:dimethylaniline monooxygenase (N-oxide forming)
MFGSWGVSYLLGDIDLPDEQTMAKEVAEYLAWARMRYCSVGERYPYALFDWIGYLDGLLRDMGVKSRRKGNFLSEFFSPYGPDVYANCMEEYKAIRLARLRASFADNKTVSSSSGSSSG